MSNVDCRALFGLAMQELVHASVELANNPPGGTAPAMAAAKEARSGRGHRPPHMGRQVGETHMKCTPV